MGNTLFNLTCTCTPCLGVIPRPPPSFPISCYTSSFSHIPASLLLPRSSPLPEVWRRLAKCLCGHDVTINGHASYSSKMAYCQSCIQDYPHSYFSHVTVCTPLAMPYSSLGLRTWVHSCNYMNVLKSCLATDWSANHCHSDQKSAEEPFIFSHNASALTFNYYTVYIKLGDAHISILKKLHVLSHKLILWMQIIITITLSSEVITHSHWQCTPVLKPHLFPIPQWPSVLQWG